MHQQISSELAFMAWHVSCASSCALGKFCICGHVFHLSAGGNGLHNHRVFDYGESYHNIPVESLIFLRTEMRPTDEVANKSCLAKISGEFDYQSEEQQTGEPGILYFVLQTIAYRGHLMT